MSQTPKLQRWIDLVAALLERRYGLTLAELRERVPGYARGRPASVRRTFERDKDELRRLGVPITVLTPDGAADARYGIAADRFYLPYLALATHRGTRRPRRIDRYGYRALEECAFSTDELHLLADAAARVAALGDPVLAADARQGLAKLAIDLPADALDATPRVRVVPPRARAREEVLTALGDALRRRKQVSFTYYGIERDETERRTVLPYGLAFTAGHWYLHAQDPARGAVRVFRVSRIEDLSVNPTAPGTQDFEIPAAFALADRALPVPPWQLGDDPPVEVLVSFTAATGVVRAARRLGTVVRNGDGTVRFTVRRREPFLRWLLGLAGDAAPISPPDVVREFRALLQRTLAATAPQ
ncbi:MAG: helix-turn-helix transcriptional regulator [Gemmatimonadales bacterium]